MMRSLLISLFAGSLLSTSVAHATCPAGKAGLSQNAIAKLGALRPDKPRMAGHEKPAIRKPSVTAESWGISREEHVQVIKQYHMAPPPPANYRSDPYKITVGNLNEGTKVVVTRLGEAEPIQMPTAVRLPLMSAAARKVLNRAYNTQLARAVATARKELPLVDGVAPGPGMNTPLVIERPEVLPTRTQLVVRATDRFGRKYPTVRATVTGAAATEQRHDSGDQTSRNGNLYTVWRKTTIDRTGGHLAPTLAPKIVPENLRATPVYVKDGQSFAKVLSLAALPANATVTLTNVRMQAEDPKGAHSVTFRANRYGAGAKEIRALVGDKIRVHVQTQGEGGSNEQAASGSYTFEIPRAQHGGPVDYLAIK